jgi:hypothetical protein
MRKILSPTEVPAPAFSIRTESAMKNLPTQPSAPDMPPARALAVVRPRRNSLPPKPLLCCLFSLPFVTGCTEKTGVTLSVMRDKTENRLLALAGEGEVTIELHRQQHADLKERLVQLKTLLSQHRDSLEQAYASDDTRRIQIYTDLVTQLSEKIPRAGSALRQGHLAFETQREKVRRIRDEIASVRATGMLSETLGIESDFQKRAALIRDLPESL